MSLSPKALKLIDDLYHCALDTQLWHACMQSLAEEVATAMSLSNPEQEESISGPRASNELTNFLAGFVADGWHPSILDNDIAAGEEGQTLAALKPHLERVLGIAQRLAWRRTEAQLDILDKLNCGCFLIDWRGTVSRCNAAASSLLGQDLQINQGRLVARDHGSNAHLQSIIAQAIRPGIPMPKMQLAMRRTNAPPLVVEAMQVTGGIVELFLDSAAILTIEGARPKDILSNDLLSQAFSLTQAEARIAALLGSGRELSEAASELGIAKETARSHLKSIFLKTGTNRQAELVSLLSGLRR